MCDYKRKYEEDYKCPHPNYGPNKDNVGVFCIFHSDREDKDAEKFYKGFKKLYKSGKHDFHGFVFPKDFSFGRLKEEAGTLKFVDAVFSETHFLCDVDLSEAEFRSKVGTDFSFAKFFGQGKTSFRGAQFFGDGVTYFIWAHFSGGGGTYFNTAKFSGKIGTYFNNAQFSGDGGTNFSMAKFSSEGGTYFNNTQFSGEGGTYFFKAQFSGDGGAYFNNAKFSGGGGTYFNNAKFSEKSKVLFEGKTFEDNLIAYFSNLNIEKDAELIFDEVNLNRAKFLGTDLEKINFKEVYWTNEKFKSKWGLRKKKIFDDTFQSGTILNRKGEKYHYPVYLLYNQLIKNYESTNRHHEAGDFFAGMMDMRRRGNLDRKLFPWITLHIYKVISEYGERPLRTLLLLFLTPILFMPLYFFNGLKHHPDFPNGHIINYKLAFSLPGPTFWKDLVDTLYYSISNVAFGRFFTEFISGSGLSTLFTILENIIGVILISLFILAMNRKFRRTKD